MVAISKLALGAPNIYRAPQQTRRGLDGVRMDVCGFVGVAPRGPARLPDVPEWDDNWRSYLDPQRSRRRSVAVAVESWDEYRSLYGGFEGPGLLPYAVASFFEQGGRKAYIVRIVRDYGNSAEGLAESHQGIASALLNGVSCNGIGVRLEARNEGAWGNGVQAALGFSVSPLKLLPDATTSQLQFDLSESLHVGSLLRLAVPLAGEEGGYEQRLCFVTRVNRHGMDDAGNQVQQVTLDCTLPQAAAGAELVEGEMLIDDGAGVVEQFDHLGLSASHPRWLAWVLYAESALVYPGHDWLEGDLLPCAAQPLPMSPQQQMAHSAVVFSGGRDRYGDIAHQDFFDHQWVAGNDTPGDGVHALTLLADLSSVVVPDLYVAKPLAEVEPIVESPSLAGPEFTTCVHHDTAPVVMRREVDEQLQGLLLDPSLPDERERIITLQRRLVALAESQSSFVVLLDAPPGLTQRQLLQWRAQFHSSYVAAYYPWVKVACGSDGRDALIRLTPSAVAAGIIARQELAFGVVHGPANVIAQNVVVVDERISAARHDALHSQGVNIFLQERDGVWLSAGRTLSRDRDYRQLSVRRLMLMLRRALSQQMQWMVFEPNTPSLWRMVRHMLNSYLRQLFIVGAFKGNNEEEGFFVRCDAELNDQRSIDAGRLVVEIGVAPTEPLEFIVLRITRSADANLTVEG